MRRGGGSACLVARGARAGSVKHPRAAAPVARRARGTAVRGIGVTRFRARTTEPEAAGGAPIAPVCPSWRAAATAARKSYAVAHDASPTPERHARRSRNRRRRRRRRRRRVSAAATVVVAAYRHRRRERMRRNMKIARSVST